MHGLHNLLWASIIPYLVVFSGIYLLCFLGLKPYKGFLSAVRALQKKSDKKGISPLQALSTALSGTVGTGTVAGVATAIHFGGPAALFFMWITAILGMLLKYCEALLSIYFRKTNSQGRYYGGPMYYMLSVFSFSKIGYLLANLYAIACMLSAFGIGAAVQANSIVIAFNQGYGLDIIYSGTLLFIITFLVVIGGMKRIVVFAEYVVPIMIASYLLMCSWVLLQSIDKVPMVFYKVFYHAFYGYNEGSLWNGVSAGIMIQQGVSRSIFTNEAGLGSSAFAHAASNNEDALSQASVSMLSTVIDTLIVSTMTAFVVLLSGSIVKDYQGVSLTLKVLSMHINFAEYILPICVLMFGLTTMFSWCYYGEQSASYLNPKFVPYFLFFWLCFVVFGVVSDNNIVWLYSDMANALMMLPNLFVLIYAAPILRKLINNNVDK